MTIPVICTILQFKDFSIYCVISSSKVATVKGKGGEGGGRGRGERAGVPMGDQSDQSIVQV